MAPVVLPVGADGKVSQDVDYEGDEGMLGMHVGEGTEAKDEQGQPVQKIDVERVCVLYPAPPAKAYIIGCAYDFGPEGMTFNPPAKITLTYDEGQIPAGIDEKDLVIAYYDKSQGKWVKLPSVVDTVNNKVTADVSGFSMFAVYAEEPEATETATPVPTATPTPEPEEGGVNIGVIIGPIIAVIVIGIVAYLLLRRRGAAGA